MWASTGRTAAEGEKSPIGTNARAARPAGAQEGRSRPRSGQAGRSSAAQTFHHGEQITAHESKGDAFRPELPFGHDNNIHARRHKSLVKSKKFPEHPFDPIPPYRRADFFGNSKTDAPIRPGGCVRKGKHNKVPGKKTMPCLVARREFGPPEQSMLTRSGQAGQSGFTMRHETAPAAGGCPRARPREQFPGSCGML